ncbi:hypothetical protein EYF80_049718 [Liparis tanakae]|uniref:Uncharacterized protein n=1 Tax=Liparis tanakae TaxID=230148 RepID=A0A4Z2FH61_9TELE|nr:hypothetical protein EYF80_049718 [Liparis tanakae]
MADEGLDPEISGSLRSHSQPKRSLRSKVKAKCCQTIQESSGQSEAEGKAALGYNTDTTLLVAEAIMLEPLKRREARQNQNQERMGQSERLGAICSAFAEGGIVDVLGKDEGTGNRAGNTATEESPV